MLYRVYVNTRPGLQQFLKELDSFYEIILFTASMRDYANPIILKIDPYNVIKYKLFRNSCLLNKNNLLVKDLSKLGRDLKDVVLLDVTN